MSNGALCELGRRIAELRGKESQTAFGKRWGVSQGAVSGWETGDKRIPVDTLVAMARHYGVDARWLLTGEGSREPRKPSDAEDALAVIRATLSDRALVRRMRKLLDEWSQGGGPPPESGDE